MFYRQSQSGFKSILRICLTVVPALALAVSAGPAEARPLNFSAIVPKEVTISTGALSGGSNGWGWIMATTDPITLADVRTPGDSWSDSVAWTPLGNAGGAEPSGLTTRYNNEHTWTANGGLQPGQIAGNINAFNTPFYADAAGKSPDLEMSAIQGFISFQNGPAKPTGDYFLDAVIRIGSDADRVDLPYTVLVHFSPTAASQVNSAQLITATPEPGTAALLAIAFGAVGVRRRRRPAG
jgi:hypothetical protein